MINSTDKAMNAECTRNLEIVLELAENMLELADAGDEIREDVGCGILYGTLRDCAYKLRGLAQAELLAHQKKAEFH